MTPYPFPTPTISPLSQVWLEKRAASARAEAAAGVAEEEGGDLCGMQGCACFMALRGVSCSTEDV